MADDDAPQTLAEMTANLAEYKEQLEQVRASPPLPIHRFGSCRARAGFGFRLSVCYSVALGGCVLVPLPRAYSK